MSLSQTVTQYDKWRAEYAGCLGGKPLDDKFESSGSSSEEKGGRRGGERARVLAKKSRQRKKKYM